MPKLHAEGLMLLSLAFVACAREAPVPAPTPAAVAMVDAATASAPAVPMAAMDGKDLALASPSMRVPSLKLLRDLAEGREDVRGVIDSEEGVAFVVIGSSYNPETGKTEQVKTAEKWCGGKVASDVERELRMALVNVHSDDQMVCKDLACVHEASGEWDAQVRFELAHKNGRLILVAIERVLDAPLRPGAEKDISWARQQRTRLVKERCHSR